MFTLVNTWMGYHQGKPRVLREAVLAVRLRLLFHFPEGKRDAASALKCSAPEGILQSSPLPAAILSSHQPLVEPQVTLSRHTPQEVTTSRLSELLRFLDAALLSISLQKETSAQDKLKQARPRKLSFYLLSIFFLLQKYVEQIPCWHTPLLL